jgi:hypothetical protein
MLALPVINPALLINSDILWPLSELTEPACPVVFWLRTGMSEGVIPDIVPVKVGLFIVGPEASTTAPEPEKLVNQAGSLSVP